MSARDHCLACLNAEQPAFFEAALWVAAEHDPAVQPQQLLHELEHLKHQVDSGLPNFPPQELAQQGLRQFLEIGRAHV